MEEGGPERRFLEQETGSSPYYVSSADWPNILEILQSLSVDFSVVPSDEAELQMRRIAGDFVFFNLYPSAQRGNHVFRTNVEKFLRSAANAGIEVRLLRG